jgi:hypothetical protein
MKHLFVIAALLLSACAGTSDKRTGKLQQRDTTLTAVAYALDWNRNDLRLSSARRIVYDSLMPDSTNPSKNIIQRVQVYEVPLFINLFDTITRKPILDSNKQQVQVIRWYILDTSLLLQDYNKDFLRDTLKRK